MGSNGFSPQHPVLFPSLKVESDDLVEPCSRSEFVYMVTFSGGKVYPRKAWNSVRSQGWPWPSDPLPFKCCYCMNRIPSPLPFSNTELGGVGPKHATEALSQQSHTLALQDCSSEAVTAPQFSWEVKEGLRAGAVYHQAAAVGGPRCPTSESAQGCWAGWVLGALPWHSIGEKLHSILSVFDFRSLLGWRVLRLKTSIKEKENKSKENLKCIW